MLYRLLSDSQIYRTHTATKDTNQTKLYKETSKNLQYSNSQFNVTLYNLGVLNCSPNNIYLILTREA